MPKNQRKDLPRGLYAHILDRIHRRHISADDLTRFALWLDTNPEVSSGACYKRFSTMTVCGEGPLVKTILEPGQTAIGTEIE
jgi:hypothetical protein